LSWSTGDDIRGSNNFFSGAMDELVNEERILLEATVMVLV